MQVLPANILDSFGKRGMLQFVRNQIGKRVAGFLQVLFFAIKVVDSVIEQLVQHRFGNTPVADLFCRSQLVDQADEVAVVVIHA